MTDKHWNWDHLRHFLALAEHRTLSAAGRELDVSHSTVLRRVRAFEESLKTRLFEHTSVGYKLTNAGTELHQQASQMKFALDAVARDISGTDQEVAGDIVIATTDSLACMLIPELLKELSELHSDLNFKVLMGTQMSNVEDREVDIAIRACKEPPDNLIGRQIGTVKFSACASPDYISAHQLDSFPEDPTGHRMICLTGNFQGTPFYDWMKEQLTAETQVLEVNTFLLAASMCRAGLGITVLPDYMLHNDPHLQVLETAGPIAQNALWILCHTEHRDTERIKLVRHHLFAAMSRRFTPSH